MAAKSNDFKESRFKIRLKSSDSPEFELVGKGRTTASLASGPKPNNAVTSRKVGVNFRRQCPFQLLIARSCPGGTSHKAQRDRTPRRHSVGIERHNRIRSTSLNVISSLVRS